MWAGWTLTNEEGSEKALSLLQEWKRRQKKIDSRTDPTSIRAKNMIVGTGLNITAQILGVFFFVGYFVFIFGFLGAIFGQNWFSSLTSLVLAGLFSGVTTAFILKSHRS